MKVMNYICNGTVEYSYYTLLPRPDVDTYMYIYIYASWSAITTLIIWLLKRAKKLFPETTIANCMILPKWLSLSVVSTCITAVYIYYTNYNTLVITQFCFFFL